MMQPDMKSKFKDFIKSLNKVELCVYKNGMIELMEKKVREAVVYFKKTRDLFIGVEGDDKNIPLVNYRLGMIHLQFGETEKAKKYLELLP